ncbi:MAG: hypothetical protein GXN92_02230 [Candidatus Micrarchaeota archaeon]|nr:hypothetical protein [Candidatus Micrarchaeota archaeon]
MRWPAHIAAATLVTLGLTVMHYTPYQSPRIKQIGDFLKIEKGVEEVRISGPYGEFISFKDKVHYRGLIWKGKRGYYLLLGDDPTKVSYFRFLFPLGSKRYYQQKEIFIYRGFLIDGEVPEEYLPTLERYSQILTPMVGVENLPIIYIHHLPEVHLTPYGSYSPFKKRVLLVYRPGHPYILSHELAHFLHQHLPEEKKRLVEELWHTTQAKGELLVERNAIPGALANAGHPWSNPSEFFASTAAILEHGEGIAKLKAYSMLKEVLGEKAVEILMR